MTSKDFPFKIVNKEFEADVLFSGEPAVFVIVNKKTGSGFEVNEYIDLRHINSPEGQVDLRFTIECFEVGQTIVLCCEKSAQKLE